MTQEKTENLRIRVPITPEVDERATKKAFADVRKIQKELEKFDLTWKGIGKQASLNVKEINKISTSAAQLGRRLGTAAKESYKELKDLADQLESAKDKAESLERQYAGAKGADKTKLGAEVAKQYNLVKKLNEQIGEQGKKTKQFNAQHSKAIKQHEEVRMKVKKSVGEIKGDFKNVVPGILKMLTGKGGVKGIGAVLEGLGEKVVKHRGVAAGAAEVAGGGPGGASAALGAAGAAIGGAVIAITALVKLIAAASDHMTDLNKALVAGGGFVNDFVNSTAQYKNTVGEMRNAAIDMRSEVMKYGMTSEDVLKSISAFSRESTGSLIKTHDTLKRLGGGDVQVGMKTFAETAQVYGKALGMEATEVAGMMGKFVSETGYGADQVQNVMGNIVKAAATANMPMTKFMDIFRRVIPDVELYQNRIEELTGTIKLLSRTMSAKDVQNFMDAFSKGFKGTDFKSRLKTMLIVGQGRVSEALGKDFTAKAQTLAKAWEKYGIKPDDVVKAMHKGEAGMASLVADVQAKASQQGEVVSGEQISNAMKLAGYEQARKEGGLSTATAMSGAGTMATYKILKDLSQSFTKGFNGLSEHVIKQLGITEQQYEALRTTHQSMEANRKMLDKYGKLNSKSMNKALRETISLRKTDGKSTDALVDLKEATEDDLIAAAERSNAEQSETRKKAVDLATEQYNITSSISDKLENYIGYLLEKLYQVMQPLLDYVGDILAWIIGDKDTVKQTKAVDKLASDMKDWNKDLIAKTPDAGTFIDDMAESIKKGMGAGKKGADLGAVVAGNKEMAGLLQSLDTNGQKSLAQQVGQMAEAEGVSASDAANMQEAFYQAMKKGDLAGAMGTLKDLPGDMGQNMMYLVQRMAKAGMIPKGIAGKDKFRREGATGPETYKTQAELDAAAAASDVEKLGEPDTTTPPAPPPPAPEKKPDSATIAAVAQAAQSAAPAAAVGTPGTTPAPVVAAATADAQQQTADGLDDQQDLTEDQLKQANAQYQATTDTLSLLKKGIRFEQSWMGTKFKNVLKEASLDSLRTALMEYAVVEEKIKDDSDLRDAILGKKGAAFAGSGKKGLDLILGTESGKVLDAMKDANVPGFATGITNVPHDMTAQLHAGERVVSAANAGRGGRGGGNRTVIVYAQGSSANDVARIASQHLKAP